MKRKQWVVTTLAVMLVLGMGVGTAWSYFTDSTWAEGSVPISVKPTTTITEENTPETKTIRIRNTGELTPVWVRARVYAAAELNPNASGNSWSGPIDSWYNYEEVLEVGEETEPLTVKFELKHVYDETENPEGAHDGEETNIVVVYETVPVTFDAEGNPMDANWND
ncbi:MAG: SipW-dependent-type signal peptide-containing protein [Atopobiaceae bacterium]|nr:SipW-dependent-type signal peptide-containing protein [Atopobiaceae bacterium]